MRQSAYAHSVGAIFLARRSSHLPAFRPAPKETTPERYRVSRGARPAAPGSDCVFTRPGTAMKRAHTPARDGRAIRVLRNGNIDAFLRRADRRDRHVTLPAAPQDRMSELVEKAVTRIAADVPRVGSVVVAAIDDVVEQDAR